MDSERTVLVYESGRLPRYAFPVEDVSVEAEPEPEVDGTCVSRGRRPIAGSRKTRRSSSTRTTRTTASRCYEAPAWFACWSRELVAETSRPRILFETGLPPGTTAAK